MQQRHVGGEEARERGEAARVAAREPQRLGAVVDVRQLGAGVALREQPPPPPRRRGAGLDGKAPPAALPRFRRRRRRIRRAAPGLVAAPAGPDVGWRLRLVVQRRKPRRPAATTPSSAACEPAGPLALCTQGSCLFIAGSRAARTSCCSPPRTAPPCPRQSAPAGR